MDFENKRVSAVGLSPNMAIALAARQLAAQGQKICDLSLGEPDFEPPEHVREAACKAITDGGIRYMGPAGLASLREAIVGKFERDNALAFQQDEVAIANGARQILFNAFLATLEPEDEVVIPVPCWSSYADMVRVNGGKPVLVKCDQANGFKLTAEQLSKAITHRTRWLILNSPGNPTGALYSRAEYAALGQVLQKWPRVLIASDEIYEQIVYASAKFVSFGTVNPELRQRTLLINGMSKTYAMTGWRVGYAAGPKELISALNKVQSHSVTCVCSVTQAAAVAALTGPQNYVGDVVAQYARRRSVILDLIDAIPALHMREPDGAFYGFVDIGRLLGSETADGEVLADDVQLTKHLLHRYGVAFVPGSAFFSPCHLRLSFATSERDLKVAMERLADMVTAIRQFAG